MYFTNHILNLFLKNSSRDLIGFSSLNNFVKQPTLVTDVGSTKVSVIQDYKDVCNNKNIQFVPSHPIAGIEKSGPEYGFAKLFENRFCILTPINNNNDSFNRIC